MRIKVYVRDRGGGQVMYLEFADLFTLRYYLLSFLEYGLLEFYLAQLLQCGWELVDLPNGYYLDLRLFLRGKPKWRLGFSLWNGAFECESHYCKCGAVAFVGDKTCYNCSDKLDWEKFGYYYNGKHWRKK